MSKLNSGGLNFNDEPPSIDVPPIPLAPSLSQTQAIKLLNEWGSRGFFRDKNLGNSIHIEAIESTPCFTFHAKTQYEHRSVETLSQPYYGEKLDNKGTPPDMRQITVEKPSWSFENTFTDVIIPHTDKVSTCNTCYGNCRVICLSCGGCGEKNCSNCSGSGRVSCGSCGGGGSYSRTTYETINACGDQPSRQEMKIENFSCDSCRGSGKRICNTCNGSGRLTCSLCGGCGEVNCETCQAQGRVKTYEMLHVLFEYQERSQTIGAMEIPNNKLSKVTGNQVLNKREDRITTLAEISDKKLAKHALEFLSQFETSKNSIILYQHFEIDEIPVFKVSYKKHSNSKEKSLWMYGNEYEVYFEGTWNITPEIKKGVLVSLAVLSTTVGIGGAYFFNRHTDFSPVTESSTTTINASPVTEDSTATTNDTCEVLQIEKRRLALGIDQRRYTSEVKARFRKQYPALASALDAENKDLTSDMADWCTIAHAWLKEQEKQQVSPEELQSKPRKSSGVIESPTRVCSMILKEKLDKKTGKLEKTNPCAD
jgi:hypothetical protein